MLSASMDYQISLREIGAGSAGRAYWCFSPLGPDGAGHKLIHQLCARCWCYAPSVRFLGVITVRPVPQRFNLRPLPVDGLRMCVLTAQYTTVSL